jgi:GntR family transcriptional repressor for pyruvate dehydrogenase complex
LWSREHRQAVADYLASAVMQEKDRLAEIFQIRVMLEPQVAALAAENASREDVKHLADLYARQLTAESRQALIKLDRDFHLALAKSTGNKALCGIIKGMNDLVVPDQARGNRQYQPDSKVTGMAWHDRAGHCGRQPRAGRKGHA